MPKVKIDLDELKDTILKLTILNAITHNGKAQEKPVIAKLAAERPGIRNNINEYIPLVDETVRKVNKIPTDEQVALRKSKWPDFSVGKRNKERTFLPLLLDAERYDHITTRFAPNPDCVLHLGSARAIILSYEYARSL